MPGTYKDHGDIRSGNCYKVKLLMSVLDIEREWIRVESHPRHVTMEQFGAG